MLSSAFVGQSSTDCSTESFSWGLFYFRQQAVYRRLEFPRSVASPHLRPGIFKVKLLLARLFLYTEKFVRKLDFRLVLFLNTIYLATGTPITPLKMIKCNDKNANCIV